jgi:hypothetical protein
MIVKPFVGAHYNRSYARRNLGEAGFEKVDDATGSMGVAGPQFPVPEVSALALEAEQRMVGGSATLDRVVADARLLLFAVDHEHCGIHIEDDARRWLGNQSDPLKEAVMQSAELRQRSWGNPEQEAPQRRRVGIPWQASEVLKDAVLSEQLSRFDSLQSQDHRIEQGQNHLADAVAIVSLSESNIRGERVLEPDPRRRARWERRLGELTRVFALQEILNIVELLLAEGFAEIAPSVAPPIQRGATAYPIRPGVGDFPRAKNFMVNTANHFVGVFASALIDRLERAESIADLVSHREEWRKAIAGSRNGSSQVESLARDLNALLGK